METLTFKRPQTQQAPGVTPGLTFRRPEPQDPLARADSVLKRYEGKRLTKEDFLADQDLMGLVRENMGARFRDQNIIGKVYSGATALAGGATAGSWQDLSDEELFETWQNYHRSFAGGQSVTTANEVAYVAAADDQTKQLMGLGYKLFDNMDNAFTGEGTWSESFDAVGDYMSAAIWDPTTLLSLGVGKAFTAGGTKAASVALRQAAKTAFQTTLEAQLKQGVARQVAQGVADQAAKKVISDGFKRIGAQRATRATVAAGATDLVTITGLDVLNQDVKIKTGAQDEYNPIQTAVSALGVIALPAMVYGAKGAAQGLSRLSQNTAVAPYLQRYEAMKTDFIGKDKDTITQAMKDRIDLTAVNKNLQDSFANFRDNMDAMAGWNAAKEQALKDLPKKGLEPKITRDDIDFFDTFLFGYTNKAGKEVDGLVQSLAKAGFVYVPRGSDDKISNWIGDAIQWLDPKIVRKAVREFEKGTGKPLGIGYKPQDVAQVWKLRQSYAGLDLYLSRRIGDFVRRGDTDSTVNRFMDDLTKETEMDEGSKAAYGAWVQSVWKRMVTAHPGTTGLNVKGWSQLTLLNSVSDLTLGMLNFGQAAYKGIKGETAAAAKLMQRGKGSMLGTLRRGYGLLDLNATLEEGMALLEANPRVARELFRYGTGEAAESANPLKDSNIKGKGFEATEKVVNGLQTIAGVTLQDEITKVFSLVTSLDRAILREYGTTYNEFMSRPDKWIEMASPRFQDNVMAPAMDRTLRETASKAWTDKKGSNFSLMIAKFVERLSNNPVSGYAIPFGRFFNTATATLGDFSMINFIRHQGKKFRGAKVDASLDEEAELLAKGITGWGIVASFVPGAIEKIESGLAWNQEREDDGSIKDTTYDFPESFGRIAGQALGHIIKDGEVPADLQTTMFEVYGAQTFRATQEGVQAVGENIGMYLSGDFWAAATESKDIIANFMAGIVSGVTRPLDPVNIGVGVATGDLAVPDRRQGSEFYNEATRYIDKIFQLPQEEQRFLPSRGGNEMTDMGRVLGGVRSTPENTPSERMMNSIGLPSWKAVRFDGDPQVKNRLDELFAPLFNNYAEAALSRHPDFYDLSLERRQLIFKTEVQEPAKKAAEDILKKGLGDDKKYDLIRQISGEGQGKLRRVLQDIGMEDMSLGDIADMEGGNDKLQMILYLLKEREDILKR